MEKITTNKLVDGEFYLLRDLPANAHFIFVGTEYAKTSFLQQPKKEIAVLDQKYMSHWFDPDLIVQFSSNKKFQQ